MKVYAFWYGDPGRKAQLERKFAELNGIVGPRHEFVLGPTDALHAALTREFEYYAASCAAKKYSYMTDVYRFWKLASNPGVYVDALIGVNKAKIAALLDGLEARRKSFVLKEDKYYAHSCLFYVAGAAAQRVCALTAARYAKYKRVRDVDLYEASPLQFTHSLRELGLFAIGYEFAQNDTFDFLPLTFIDKTDPENVFWYSFEASWKKNNKNNEKKWERAFANYYRRKHKSPLVGLYGALYWKAPALLRVALFFYGKKAYMRYRSLTRPG